ncbi:MAG: phosphoribosylaminoimidazolecarboxamide formyltransferase/IMP cyclohydrolase [Ignavibacteria bacterium]|nr:phosphoribosylaminoimidazolecarboxamide formyltransferase/IMP cyclohydrolase [Ignavibacteria bacterium]
MNSDNYKIERALISVSDKTGIVEFASALTGLGIAIYSTGGTFDILKKNNIPAKSVSDLTNFPEIMDGRVKTLHPGVHAGLLADLGKETHRNQLSESGLLSIDLLVVNLYPFDKVLEQDNASHEELIENIDIGGPAMLRSASKNYKWTVPVVNADWYNQIIELLRNGNCTIPEKVRQELAGEAFAHTANYDCLISGYFNKINDVEFPEKFSIGLNTKFQLRYGENPHQQASLYGNFDKIFTKLHGKELSYNNILDIDSASKLILEFDTPAFAIIKHTNPSGVGLDESLVKAYQKAYATDTVSPFGGIFVVNRLLDLDIAEAIHGIFSEVIIAPKFTDEALALLTKKKDRRLIVMNFELLANAIRYDIKSVTGGFLMQDTDRKLQDDSQLRCVTKRQPTQQEQAAMLMGWKVAKHVKSNSIVYSSADRTLGIGAGQMSRVDSARIAVEKAKQMGLDLKGSSVASDAFFPFADGLLQAVEAGATAVIQPGGSVRDEEVIKVADENNIAMIFTGMRHFKH